MGSSRRNEEHEFVKSRPVMKDGICPVGYKKRKAYIIQKTAKLVPARCIKEETTNTSNGKNVRRCPAGQTYRRSYMRKYSNTVKREGFLVRRKGTLTRIYPKEDIIKVPGACVPISGMKETGYTIKDESLEKGELLKFGYTFRLPDTVRHEALHKAIQKYGVRHVYRKLHTVSKLFRTSKPEAANVFRDDAKWVKSHYRIN
jgi:hypothetical protein